MVINIVNCYFVNRINNRLIHGTRGRKISYILFIPLKYLSQRAKQSSETHACICVQYFSLTFFFLKQTCTFTFALFNVIFHFTLSFITVILQIHPTFYPTPMALMHWHTFPITSPHLHFAFITRKACYMDSRHIVHI